MYEFVCCCCCFYSCLICDILCLCHIWVWCFVDLRSCRRWNCSWSLLATLAIRAVLMFIITKIFFLSFAPIFFIKNVVTSRPSNDYLNKILIITKWARLCITTLFTWFSRSNAVFCSLTLFYNVNFQMHTDARVRAFNFSWSLYSTIQPMPIYAINVFVQLKWNHADDLRRDANQPQNSDTVQKKRIK